MYELVYSGIEQPPWMRARSYDINELINLADEEQGEYDSCHIQLENGKAIWEPSLGCLICEEIDSR